MKVFTTRATGFIGAHVAGRLRARGEEVAVLVRSPGKAGALGELGCELVEGRLTDEEAGRARTRGCDRDRSRRRRLQTRR